MAIIQNKMLDSWAQQNEAKNMFYFERFLILNNPVSTLQLPLQRPSNAPTTYTHAYGKKKRGPVLNTLPCCAHIPNADIWQASDFTHNSRTSFSNLKTRLDTIIPPHKVFIISYCQCKKCQKTAPISASVHQGVNPSPNLETPGFSKHLLWG